MSKDIPRYKIDAIFRFSVFLEDGKFIINTDTSSFGIEARRARKLIF